MNEGFAAYFQYVGLEEADSVELTWDQNLGVGSWDLDDMFISEQLIPGLETDDSVYSQPLMNTDNNWQDSDWGPIGIVYRKGNSITLILFSFR